MADRQLSQASQALDPPSPSPSTTFNGDKTHQVLCPSRICQVSSLDCESVLDRLAPSYSYSYCYSCSALCPAMPCPILPCHCTGIYAWKHVRVYLCMFACGRCSPIDGTRTQKQTQTQTWMQMQMQLYQVEPKPKSRCRQTSPSIRGHRRHLSRACMLRPMALCHNAVPCPVLPCPALSLSWRLLRSICLVCRHLRAHHIRAHHIFCPLLMATK